MNTGMRMVAGVAAGAMIAATAGCTMWAPPAPKTQPRYGVSLDGDPESDQTLVREQAFRILLEKHPKEQWAFLSYGQGESSRWTNPTREVVDRLADLEIKIAPASMGNVPRAGAGGIVLHAKTGEQGILYGVKIVKWIDDDTALVEGARHEGTAATAGFSATFKRLSGNVWRAQNYSPWVR